MARRKSKALVSKSNIKMVIMGVVTFIVTGLVLYFAKNSNVDAIEETAKKVSEGIGR